MRYMGCDCNSKAIDCFLIETGRKKGKPAIEGSAYSFKSKSSDFEKRSYEVFDEFKKFLMGMDVKVVYVEQPVVAYGRKQNVKTTLGISNTVNAVRYACHMLKIPVVVVDNTHWKKLILGNGRAKKEEIMVFAKKRWGDVVTSQDSADASCIALLAYNERKG